MYNGDNPIVFSAPDFTNHSSCRRSPGRASRAGEEDSGIGDNSGEEGSGSNESDIEEHLGDVHGRGGPIPDGPHIARRWGDGRGGAAEVNRGEWATGLETLASETTWALGSRRPRLTSGRVKKTRSARPPSLSLPMRGRSLWQAGACCEHRRSAKARA